MTDFREQTQAHTETDGTVPGDCWRTAIACLLEIPRDDVPHFVHEYTDAVADDAPELGPAWWRATVEFVERVRPGWTLRPLEPSWPVYLDPENAPQRVILSGKSPRGDWLHAVVADARTGTIVWDVHPDRTGLIDHLDVMALTEREAAA